MMVQIQTTVSIESLIITQYKIMDSIFWTRIPRSKWPRICSGKSRRSQQLSTEAILLKLCRLKATPTPSTQIPIFLTITHLNSSIQWAIQRSQILTTEALAVAPWEGLARKWDWERFKDKEYMEVHHLQSQTWWVSPPKAWVRTQFTFKISNSYEWEEASPRDWTSFMIMILTTMGSSLIYERQAEDWILLIQDHIKASNCLHPAWSLDFQRVCCSIRKETTSKQWIKHTHTLVLNFLVAVVSFLHATRFVTAWARTLKTRQTANLNLVRLSSTGTSRRAMTCWHGTSWTRGYTTQNIRFWGSHPVYRCKAWLVRESSARGA